LNVTFNSKDIFLDGTDFLSKFQQDDVRHVEITS
jgi:hypothetical protein